MFSPVSDVSIPQTCERPRLARSGWGATAGVGAGWEGGQAFSVTTAARLAPDGDTRVRRKPRINRVDSKILRRTARTGLRAKRDSAYLSIVASQRRLRGPGPLQRRRRGRGALRFAAGHSSGKSLAGRHAACGAAAGNYGLSTAGQYVCPRCDLKQQEEADRERQRKWEGWREGQRIGRKEYKP
jgi:hypothetical protein